MAVRFYSMPLINTGPLAVRRPAYVSDGQIAGRFGGMDYGSEPRMLIWADVTPAEHAAIIAHSDVIAVPLDIESTVGANLAAVQSALELFNMPADWITSGMTYRTVLRVLAKLHYLCQAFQLNTDRLFSLTIDLSALVSDLSANVRQKVLQGAARLGLDTSGILLSMSLRTALKILFNQIQAPMVLGIPL